MNASAKHICELEYCKRHSECIFKNATSTLRADAHIAALGPKDCSDRILCYQKEDTSLFPNKQVARSSSVSHVDDWREISLVTLSKNDKQYCEAHNCRSLASLKYNDKVHLCYKCLDSLRDHRSNHELAKHFKYRHQLLKLLKEIDELNHKDKVITRCSNIYCGTAHEITRHHLIPKPYRNWSCTPADKIPLCRTCHTKVHQLRTNRQLAKHYNTKEAVIELLANETSFRVERFMQASQEAMYSEMVA